MKLYEILQDDSISIKDAYEHNEVFYWHLDRENQSMAHEYYQLRRNFFSGGPYEKYVMRATTSMGPQQFFQGNQESTERYRQDAKRAAEIEQKYDCIAWWSFSGYQTNYPTVDIFIKITNENRPFLDKVKRFIYRYRKLREKLFPVAQKRRKLRSSYMAWRRRQKAKGIEIKPSYYR